MYLSSIGRALHSLARDLDMTRTAVIERAANELSCTASPTAQTQVLSWEAVLGEFDRIADREESRDPLAWNAHGLPA
jgi:hypothetical protein